MPSEEETTSGLRRRKARDKDDRDASGQQGGRIRAKQDVLARRGVPMDEHDSLLDRRGVLFMWAAVFFVCGSFGLGFWAMHMRDIWEVEPMLALPQLCAALVLIGLGLAGFIVLACQPARRSPELPLGAQKTISAMTLEELLAGTHEYGAPLPAGVVIRAKFCKTERLQEHIVEQVGPVCAAASVSSALNVLNGISVSSGDKFRVRDTMHIYHLMFRDKRAEALSKLAKVLKIRDVESVVELFHTQDICVAARGRNSSLFLKLLASAAVRSS
jgi:hypothetical protein